jgi:dipeptidyl aminopeptidase/acylaminoacyl peptidase
MTTRTAAALTLIWALALENYAQASSSNWEQPPAPIPAILDAPRSPSLSISPDNQWLIELDRPTMPSVEQLAEPVVRIGGLQLNPLTRERARNYGYTSLRIRGIDAREWTELELPAGANLDNLSWSSDSRYLSFTHREKAGIALWVLDTETNETRALTDALLNQTYGSACTWLNTNEALLCKMRPADEGAAPTQAELIAGPLIEENLGRSTPARTYTNLLQNPHDESLFDYYMTAILTEVSLDGSQKAISPPDIFTSVSPSPNSELLLVSRLSRPYSYHVPASRFPKRVEVLNRAGKSIKEIANLPLADSIPIAFGSVRTGPRYVNWRSDKPATLAWVEALDDGDAKKEVPFRDKLVQQAAPFDAEPTELWRSTLRYGGVDWANDGLAVVSEWWYSSRQERSFAINPSDPSAEASLIFDRNYQDAYNDPGSPVSALGPYGYVLKVRDDGSLLYRGRGASPEGVYPFLDSRDVRTGESTRLWQAADPYYETVSRVLDQNGAEFISRRQSKTEPPNYFRYQAGKKRPKAMTSYTDWAPQFDKVTKELISYEREDGVQLSATLYLPAGYNQKKEGPLPFLFWAYPREHKSKKTASQITTPTQTFSRPYGSSAMFLLTQGYGVLMGPTMPIVGEGDQEPNDTYREQLVASAKAAVDALVERGVADPDRIAIGGHSYGAFTTANLLAHSDLFRAGIARSGAYNRTLTPFGFQGEQRTFWEATDVYMSMSPFTNAASIDEPMLMIHGQNDSNSGTYPVQSERLYEAMKGLGATVRWVVLPYEDHGYRSREAIGHTLWEMVEWMDTYVKPPKSPPTE